MSFGCDVVPCCPLGDFVVVVVNIMATNLSRSNVTILLYLP
jgi:hypothetical protein